MLKNTSIYYADAMAIHEDFEDEVQADDHRRKINPELKRAIQPSLVKRFEKLMKDCDEQYQRELEQKERMKERDDNEVEAPGVNAGDENKVKLLSYNKFDMKDLIEAVRKVDKERGYGDKDDSVAYWRQVVQGKEDLFFFDF